MKESDRCFIAFWASLTISYVSDMTIAWLMLAIVSLIFGVGLVVLEMRVGKK